MIRRYLGGICVITGISCMDSEPAWFACTIFLTMGVAGWLLACWATASQTGQWRVFPDGL